ncbi:MAG: glyoxalase [Chloroflexi bacterium HGW-Chloroflexi-10]|nr:MAG: glyoxalase [Chloroflexi bacterium HGW-Chloroflexi-10]
MKIIDKLTMFYMAVSDMNKAKEFYVDKLGFKVTNDYRQDDAHWWVSLDLPGGGTTFTISTDHGNIKPGGMQLYVSSPDIQAAHKLLTEKNVQSTSEIKDDLYGPGSGVKWFDLNDPDGNRWLIWQSM